MLGRRHYRRWLQLSLRCLLWRLLLHRLSQAFLGHLEQALHWRFCRELLLLEGTDFADAVRLARGGELAAFRGQMPLLCFHLLKFEVLGWLPFLRVSAFLGVCLLLATATLLRLPLVEQLQNVKIFLLDENLFLLQRFMD